MVKMRGQSTIYLFWYHLCPQKSSSRMASCLKLGQILTKMLT